MEREKKMVYTLCTLGHVQPEGIGSEDGDGVAGEEALVIRGVPVPDPRGHEGPGAPPAESIPPGGVKKGVRKGEGAPGPPPPLRGGEGGFGTPSLVGSCWATGLMCLLYESCIV